MITVNGVPYVLEDSVYISGNTDIQWALDNKKNIDIGKNFEPYHDVQAAINIQEHYDGLPPSTPEQRKKFLDGFYDEQN